jgi:C-5 cytosine-specific DNA methylase.
MVERDREKCSYLRVNFDSVVSAFNVEYEVVCRDVRDLPVISADVIVASPPCEDLTVLKYFNYNETRKETLPLTLFTLRYVASAKPALALYENVYRRLLVEVVRRHGWVPVRLDMSRIIPQKRVRLVAIYSKNTLVKLRALRELGQAKQE